MDAAPTALQIDALPVGLVGHHERPRDVGMGFGDVCFRVVFRQETDGITLAAEGASVAGDFFVRRCLWRFHDSSLQGGRVRRQAIAGPKVPLGLILRALDLARIRRIHGVVRARIGSLSWPTQKPHNGDADIVGKLLALSEGFGFFQ